MKQLKTKAIVLNRLDYGEADRIITFLTLDYGKIKGLAKGVRKVKSKLAGGIELFSVSDISFIDGRGDIKTITSTRLITYHRNIVKDFERTQLGYELIKVIDKTTEEATEPAYFELLSQAFEALDDPALDPKLINLWFNMQLLKLSGHAPNLHTDTNGTKLAARGRYQFHLDRMHFTPEPSEAGFTAQQIKFLRLGFSARRPHVLHRVEGADQLIDSALALIQTMLRSFVHI